MNDTPKVVLFTGDEPDTCMEENAPGNGCVVEDVLEREESTIVSSCCWFIVSETLLDA